MLALVMQMRVAQGLLLRGSNATASVPGPETCQVLKNEETYSSIKVSVGNPPQSFQLVADTGSDNCIVKDCVCTQCLPEWGKACFVEPKKSKTFKVPLFKKEYYGGEKQGPSPARMAMNFGSGEISAEIASDQVSIGHINANMENGLLLMYDHSLEIRAHFEGILGMGRPFWAWAGPMLSSSHAPGNPKG